jgi:hypothetical protein
MDSLLTLFTTISLLAGYSAIRGAAFRPGMWLLASIACGLGALTKGPVACALCIPPLAAASWLSTGTCRIRLRHWLEYAAIVAGIALPWFVAVAVAQPRFTGEFVLTHHLERFFSGLSHEEPFWFYLPVLLIAMMPCGILFPATFMCLVRSGNRGRALRTWDVGFLLLTAGWTLALFTVSRCKLPPYILPAIPPLCMVVGVALNSIIRSAEPGTFLNYVRERSPRDLSVIMLLAVPVVGAIDWMLLGPAIVDRTTHYILLTTTGLGVVLLLSTRLIPGGFPRWITAAAYAFAALNFGVGDFTPAIATHRCKVPEILELCGKDVPSRKPIVCVSLAQEVDSFAFYLRGQPLQSFESGQVDGAVAALTHEPSSLVFAHVGVLDQLRSRMPRSLRWSEIGRHEHIVVGRMSAPKDAGFATIADESSTVIAGQDMPPGPALFAELPFSGTPPGTGLRTNALDQVLSGNLRGSEPIELP